VRLRRTFGISGADVSRFTAFDPFTIKAELCQFGIDPWVVSGAMDGDEHQMDELSLRLMETLIEREKIEKRGGSHLQSRRIVISDSLVDFMIVAMMEAAVSLDSPNLGHESVLTTFSSYGDIAGHRQAEIIRALGSTEQGARIMARFGA
jgi:hypothetical protein